MCLVLIPPVLAFEVVYQEILMGHLRSLDIQSYVLSMKEEKQLSY